MYIAELENILECYENVVIFGAGITAQWLSAYLEGRHNVYAILDNDLKKRDLRLGNVAVTPSPDINLLDKKTLESSILINTISDIQETWIQGEHDFGCKKQIALPLLTKDIVKNAAKYLSESNFGSGSFISHSLECAMYSHKSYFDNEFVFLRSVDLMITERCSLKCTDCSNLMQYYSKPINEDFDNIFQDLELLLDGIDQLFELRIIGGEPFVHQQIYSIINKACDYSKISKVSLYTNSTLSIKIDKLSPNECSRSKLYFSITDYGDLSYKLAENISILESHEIPYRSHKPEFWTDSGTIVYEERSEDELITLFSQCCGKIYLL